MGPWRRRSGNRNNVVTVIGIVHPCPHYASSSLANPYHHYLSSSSSSFLILPHRQSGPPDLQVVARDREASDDTVLERGAHCGVWHTCAKCPGGSRTRTHSCDYVTHHDVREIPLGSRTIVRDAPGHRAHMDGSENTGAHMALGTLERIQALCNLYHAPCVLGGKEGAYASPWRGWGCGATPALVILDYGPLSSSPTSSRVAIWAQADSGIQLSTGILPA